MKTVSVFVVVLGLSLGAKLPSDFQLCKGTKDLKKCLAAAIEDALPKMKDGIPDLNVPPLEYLEIASATIGEGKGAVNVVQNYKNFHLFGVSTAKIPKLEASLTADEFKMDIEAFVPEVKFTADYNFNGRVLLLPIVGDGKCEVHLTDLKVNIKFLSKIYEKKGKQYVKVEDLTVDLNPGKVTYNFENLFNGDPRLGNEMNKLLNDNWKDVFDDVKPGYNKVIGAVFTDYCNKVFAKVPYEEMF